MTPDSDHDRSMLERAARYALRSHGTAEPNPTVGCIVADEAGAIAGSGRTGPPGGPHAEIAALANAGGRAARGTMWVTLEPCNHHGRTPPCVDAVIAAGIARVVVGRRDRHAVAAGGLERLRAAGIEVEVREDVPAVRRLHAPFERAVLQTRPWLTAKWAESAAGDLIVPPGRDRRISGDRSHRMVHRERGRCDAILTGIGTILADDPRLDPRNRRSRRIPERIVLDPAFDIPTDARILGEGAGRVVIAAHPTALERRDADRRSLEDRGVAFIALTGDPVESGWPNGLSQELLADLLERLHRDRAVSHVLTEAGPGLLDLLFEADLVDAALVFTAPVEFSGAGAGTRPRRHLGAERFERVWRGDRGEDRVAWWQRSG